MGLGPSKPTKEELETLAGQLDANLRATAEALKRADVLLLCTGAGFSADSGLAVYKDIAELSAYEDMGLHYHDLCRPQWLAHDPELFYGFWGTCYNDYRDTEPHEGYKMLRGLRDDRFSTSNVARSIQALVEEELRSRDASMVGQDGADSGGSCSSTSSPSPADDFAGAFFVYTSNVDAHSYDFFEPYEVRECHGNIEVWQCGATPKPCCDRTWRAPADFRFLVDVRTMRAPRHRSTGSTQQPDSATATQVAVAVQAESGNAGLDGSSTCTTAKAGQVHKPFGSRRVPLARLPDPGEEVSAGFPSDENWPRCLHCGGLARPAILMFGDLGWISDAAQERRWCAWRRAVSAVARSACEQGRRIRVLVLEIGCGGNVPTVRHTVERVAVDFSEDADVTVVRVNPDFPLPDRLLAPEGHLRHLALPCRGLEALRRIQRHYEALPAGLTARGAAPPQLRPRNEVSRRTALRTDLRQRPAMRQRSRHEVATRSRSRDREPVAVP